jgi:ubiquinone/menaquinone biosynthesis C-methylase UbiE
VELTEPGPGRWDAEASCYDDEPDHGLRSPVVRRAWRDVLRDVLPPPPAEVLDLACGTGSLAVLLAEDGYRVTGIDASPSMLAKARRKAVDADVSVRFGCGDVSSISADRYRSRFDLVLARYVVWLLPDPAAAVRRWLELTRTNGVLVLVEDRFWPDRGGSARDLLQVVGAVTDRMAATLLDDPELWGGTIADERLLLVCR